MDRIPLPSHIHYELLLQLLERQTLFASHQNPALREQVQQTIATLRKALAQQKQLEAACTQLNIPYEYRWSLNSPSVGTEAVPNGTSPSQKPTS
ncbi:MAG: DUF5340 domain-containing protein [Cyanobacteriota bacterium]|nr:DUF5340 domain-containing protein [Cyanobacteriota bacterium]